MQEMKQLLLKFMLFLVWLVLVSSENTRTDKSQTVTSYRTVSPDDARVIAAISTWTQLSFVTSITTVPLTCNVAVENTMACKKKRRKSFRMVPKIDSKDFLQTVDGSMNTDTQTWPVEGNERQKIDDNERSGRLALTVWRSHTSTFTMIMTATNTALTFSVSFACTIMGASFPAPCG
ncbi:hypothetical protein FHG87_018690 [Trinorchestia longiramus]|nr:hypothetical protein FHG87_018690 [Trinorchestia longiramus]